MMWKFSAYPRVCTHHQGKRGWSTLCLKGEACDSRCNPTAHPRPAPGTLYAGEICDGPSGLRAGACQRLTRLLRMFSQQKCLQPGLKATGTTQSKGRMPSKIGLWIQRSGPTGSLLTVVQKVGAATPGHPQTEHQFHRGVFSGLTSNGVSPAGFWIWPRPQTPSLFRFLPFWMVIYPMPILTLYLGSVWVVFWFHRVTDTIGIFPKVGPETESHL